MGKVRIPGGKKGERMVRQFQRPAQNRQLAEMDIPAEIFWKLVKRVEKLEKANKAPDARLDKLWKWEQERRRREG